MFRPGSFQVTRSVNFFMFRPGNFQVTRSVNFFMFRLGSFQVTRSVNFIMFRLDLSSRFIVCSVAPLSQLSFILVRFSHTVSLTNGQLFQ